MTSFNFIIAVFSFGFVVISASDVIETKHAAVLRKYNDPICMAAFLSFQFLATSCRCMGITDPESGIFTRESTIGYSVHAWTNDTEYDIKQEISAFFFHYHCGIDPNRVYIDLGFFAYINRLTVLISPCYTTNMFKAPKGVATPVDIRGPKFCEKKPICKNVEDISDCSLSTLYNNHICALGRESIDKNCPASAGAPLICHGMLVGINGGDADFSLDVDHDVFCTSVINPALFIRMDLVFQWIIDTMSANL